MHFVDEPPWQQPEHLFSDRFLMAGVGGTGCEQLVYEGTEFDLRHPTRAETRNGRRRPPNETALWRRMGVEENPH